MARDAKKGKVPSIVPKWVPGWTLGLASGTVNVFL